MIPAEETPARDRVPGCLGSITVSGVPVRFHFTFWLVVVWLIYLGASGSQSAAGNLTYVFGLFCSVLLHEAGHSVAARHYGIGTKEIVMLPLGGIARLARQPKPAEELWVALAGPLVNLLLGSALLGWAYAQGGGISLRHWLEASDSTLGSRLSVANLILAGFNLLPAFPMDGGRVLRSLLASTRTVEHATRLTARCGSAVAFAMGLYGLLNSNFVFVFAAFFVYVGATQEVLATSTQALLEGATVAEAMMTEFHTLQHGDTLREAAELLLAGSQQDFPVRVGPHVAGLLSRTALLRAMANDGPESFVAGAMERDFPRLSPSMPLEEAAPLLTSGGRCALVFDGETLAGLLNSENLSEFLVLKKIRRSREGEAA